MKFFVSYSRSVKDEVRKVVNLLKAADHEVWWDGDIPIMADWWSTILTHIEWCDVFIFVISEKSVESAYCLAELKYATDHNRPILPFVADDHTLYAIPPQVTPMRAQWFVYDGDPAKMLQNINDACEKIEWEKFRDIRAPRPPEPNKGGISLAKQYQEARRLADKELFEEAKTLFRNIKSLDYGEWGSECDEWVARLNSYASIVDLADDQTTLERARREWNEHVKQYGIEFDPHEIRTLTKRTRTVRKSSIIMIGLSLGMALAAALVVFFITSNLQNDTATVIASQVALAVSPQSAQNVVSTATPDVDQTDVTLTQEADVVTMTQDEIVSFVRPTHTLIATKNPTITPSSTITYTPSITPLSVND